ncbi:MAG: purine-nucleoside phosphorylase [Bacillota bacterium]
MQEVINYIKKLISIQPEVGLILGSGLGVLADEIDEPTYIPYDTVPNFPVSTVQGHAGRLVIGKLSGMPVVVMQGRLHYYEGYSMDKVTFPIRVMQGMGIKKLIVTNAAGGINLNYMPGTIMLIKDHLNLMGTNPLIGENLSQYGPRFPDMTYGYHPGLRELARTTAKKLEIPIEEGVYAAVTGPSYETPAEIRYLRIIGADCVGMSTAPEVIVANHGGMSVLGISCITNMAAGVTGEKLSHEEVIETADSVRDNLRKLLKEILKEMGPV